MTVPLYMPITSQPRELDAKLLLALHARDRGLDPVIGYKSTFLWHLPDLAPGIFLAHNARQKSQRLAVLREFGHRIAVLDEEALVRQTDEIFYRKHPEGAFESVDQILSWGSDDAEMWTRLGVTQPGGAEVVGNPRMDLLRPEVAAFHQPQIEAIRARFGRYILLNTNFPTVNNLTPQGGGVRMAKWAMDEKGQSLNDSFLEFKQGMLKEMLALVAPLARAIAPLSLVIRPHPNEDHAPWIEAAGDEPNVHVTFEGGVFPWVIGAEALVHNNCTTGVEAAAAGTPLINYTPFHTQFDNPIAHGFGTDCASPEQVAAVIADVLSGNRPAMTPEQRDQLRRHVASIDGPLSSARIADYLAALPTTVRPGPEAPPTRRRRERMRLRWRRAHGRIKLHVSRRSRAKRRYLLENHPDQPPGGLDHEQLFYSIEQLKLLMRQFPPLTSEALDERITRLAGALGRFGEMRAERIDKDLYRVR